MYARDEDPYLEKVRRILRLDLDIRRKLLYLCTRKSGGRAANDRVQIESGNEKNRSRFGGVKTLLYLCTRKRNERPSGDAGCLTLRDL